MTTQAKKTPLEVKVLALNLLQEYGQNFYNYEMLHFNKFTGQNIFKVDGSIKQKYDHEKQSFRGQLNDGTFVDIHYWFEKSSNYFDMCIKICVNGGSYDVQPSTAFCQYEKKTLTLFKLDKEGNLIEPIQDDSFTTHYIVDEILQAAENVKIAAEQYRKVLESVPYQFRDVLYLERLTR